MSLSHSNSAQIRFASHVWCECLWIYAACLFPKQNTPMLMPTLKTRRFLCWVLRFVAVHVHALHLSVKTKLSILQSVLSKWELMPPMPTSFLPFIPLVFTERWPLHKENAPFHVCRQDYSHWRPTRRSKWEKLSRNEQTFNLLLCPLAVKTGKMSTYEKMS